MYVVGFVLFEMKTVIGFSFFLFSYISIALDIFFLNFD